MNFDKAFHTLLGHEGAYSNDPADPGGETMWGVTEAVARENGYQSAMRALPVELAKSIYRAKYWNRIRADELPPELRYSVFDAAVNSGPGQAIRWLQRALGVADDGQLGPVTLAAALQANPDSVLRKMIGARLTFMTDLRNWPNHGRGWARRLSVLLQA